MPELTTTAQVELGSDTDLDAPVDLYTCGDASNDGINYASFTTQILFWSAYVSLNQPAAFTGGGLGFWLQIELNGMPVSVVPLQATSNPYQVQLRGGYPTSLGAGDVIGVSLVTAPGATPQPVNPITPGNSITITLSAYELTADPLPPPGP